ncbi:endonuclease V isoform X7 [Pipistrellus kuhlii]|uniref:endonuclease V isoform X7 n=1 Tax=Pipistrellus kuhlii TaxID=59472 RepID=UPI001E273DFB|nr:endonuclease V isoform X7 [Pipistrellus kuhlii]
MAQEAIGPPPEETLSLWKREQALLKARVVDQDTEAWQRDPAFAGLQRVGGVDVSFVKGDSVRACASLVVLSYPELEVLYEDSRLVHLTAPYLSGFLAFREAPFLADAVRRLREEAPSLAPQAGPPGGWKRGAPPPRLRGGLPPGRPHRPALRRGGQEAAAGGRAGEGRPAPGPDPPPARRRRLLPADRPLRGRAGPGPSEPRRQLQAALHLRGPQDEPGDGRAPDPQLLPVPGPRARAPGRHPLPRLHPQDPGRPAPRPRAGEVPTWVWPVWLSG